MPLPGDLDYDQRPDSPDFDPDAYNDAHAQAYAQGAIKALQTILMVIGKGGDLADVQRVASGALDKLEKENDAPVQR